MLEAAAAFLTSTSATGSFSPRPSFFHIPLFSPHIYICCFFCHSLIHISSFSLPVRHTLCLSCPRIPSPPPSPLSTRSVCKMIAAVGPLPTPGALTKAVLRWEHGGGEEEQTVLCTEQRTRLYSVGLSRICIH